MATKGAISIENNNSTVQQYYTSLESRIGYRVFLADRRHYGYYDKADAWPWPIDAAHRAMEAKLFAALQCPEGSRVLDAGCGTGHVALYMAKAGKYKMECIDLVGFHVAKAKANIRNAGMDDSIAARVGDYHHLEAFDDRSFDGVYTMETFVHSANPSQALNEFLRVLKPDGRLVLHEYDHWPQEKLPQEPPEAVWKVNQYGGFPGMVMFDRNVLAGLLQEAGFEDVHLTDMTKNIFPMVWFFYVFALVPYFFVQLLGLEFYFVNTMAAVEQYKWRKFWRYTQIIGRKPT